MFEWISLILNGVLGGGLLVALRQIATLKHDVRKAEEEAKGMGIVNDEKMMETFTTYIVEPLKKEINGLRRTVTKLTEAVRKANDCAHSVDCPVRHELSKPDGAVGE